MKNREKYAQEIIDIALSRDRIAIKNGRPIGCSDIFCRDCELLLGCRYSTLDAEIKSLRAWAEAEAE